MAKSSTVVYLIHLDEKLHHAGHYIGFAQRSFKARYMQHLAGRGARMLQVCNQKGITYDVVRVWRGADRAFERQLKNQKHSARLCPLCNPNFSNHGRA